MVFHNPPLNVSIVQRNYLRDWALTQIRDLKPTEFVHLDPYFGVDDSVELYANVNISDPKHVTQKSMGSISFSIIGYLEARKRLAGKEGCVYAQTPLIVRAGRQNDKKVCLGSMYCDLGNRIWERFIGASTVYCSSDRRK